MKRYAREKVDELEPGVWQWQIVDEHGTVLATSPSLKSRQECNEAINLVKDTFAKKGETGYGRTAFGVPTAEPQQDESAP